MFAFKIDDKAKKSFHKMDKSIQKQILQYFVNEELLRNPKLFGKPLLYELKGNWRYRIGDHRVICKILDDELVILAVNIAHRKEVYEDQ